MRFVYSCVLVENGKKTIKKGVVVNFKLRKWFVFGTKRLGNVFYLLLWLIMIRMEKIEPASTHHLHVNMATGRVRAGGWDIISFRV